VAPLQTARGIQNKVLEAVAAGLPTVITTAVADGLPAAVAPACRVADDAAGFARAIVDLLNAAPHERRAIAEAASLGSLGWPERLARITDILHEAAAQRTRVAAA
jgi:glycosyltransferase involved in cell wall biosynthesis